jgi:hypothetical protein
MSQGSLSVIPMFATPLGVVTLPTAMSRLTPTVAQLLAQHAAANPAPATADRLCYHSRDDLLEWSEEPVQQLCEAILRGVWSTVAAVTTLAPEQLQTLSMQARGRFTIVQPDGCLPATSHSLTAWAGIYCLQAPAPTTERGDSGVVRFYESRLGTMIADATTSAMRIPFTTGHYTWRAVPGQLVVFPGSLTHEIPLIRSVSPFTLISVRTRFVGPGQEGMARW